MRSTRFPACFVDATWHSTFPPNKVTGEWGLSFVLADGSTVRLILPAEHARHVHETLAPDYDAKIQAMAQSAMLSLRSSEPKSTPSGADS